MLTFVVTCLALLWASSVRLELVSVTGATRADDAEIRRLSGLRNGVRTSGLTFSEVRLNVEKHPWVSTAKVQTKGFWRSVSIEVSERTPSALTVEDGQLVYVDENGHTIAPASLEDSNYPMITIKASIKDTLRARADAVALLSHLGGMAKVDQDALSEVVMTEGGVHVNLLNGSCLLVPTVEQAHSISRFSTLIDRGAVHFGIRQMIDLTPKDVAVVTPLAASKRGCS
jgi:cell division septal protein FtsQ